MLSKIKKKLCCDGTGYFIFNPKVHTQFHAENLINIGVINNVGK